VNDRTRKTKKCATRWQTRYLSSYVSVILRSVYSLCYPWQLVVWLYCL